LPPGVGALVQTVNPGEPADEAGMEPGDVIIEYNGERVTSNEQLISMVVGTRPDTTVPIVVMRDGKRITLKVTVDELNLEEEQRGRRTSTQRDEPTTTGFGMTLEPLSPEISRQLDVPRGRGGAVV